MSNKGLEPTAEKGWDKSYSYATAALASTTRSTRAIEPWLELIYAMYIKLTMAWSLKTGRSRVAANIRHGDTDACGFDYPGI